MRPAGRFAPSPTGPLHLGSLLCAFASRLDALHSGGRWLLRIDDLDSTRCRPLFEEQIVRVLVGFGFQPDLPPLRQSGRRERYAEAVQRLSEAGLTFTCDCTRRERAARVAPEGELEPVCVGDCRRRAPDPARSALRVALDAVPAIEAPDRSLGFVRFDPSAQRDVVVRRRDGLHTYPLAVVLDDADQGVTDVVRGADLHAGTGVQLALQRLLGLKPPRYLHLPLLVERDGSKLSKSRHSLPVGASDPCGVLRGLLALLGQPKPPAGSADDLEKLWEWAVTNWSLKGFGGARTLPAPPIP